MADNRIARGIVLVPCLLLGGAFLATAAWGRAPQLKTAPWPSASVLVCCWRVGCPSWVAAQTVGLNPL